ncbi:phage portal protein [Candidatus Paracaedibacter symbiosus]|uniref:phage portal protein n=1 Tax=Candidatus Paracaedibacter symbiosus TaxID=244582 RepID=UPI000A0693CB|nr:phage portal protein [Candidatus Paracaedibacter symbiosus]
MKRFWKTLTKGLEQPKKTGRSTAPYVAYNLLGRPVWTPRDYQQLADEGYQKNVIVYRCVNLITRGISSIPWLLYDRDAEVERHPILELLHVPNPRQAGSAFMESLMGHLLLSGNAYIQAIFDGDNLPCELYPLRPDRMKVIPGESGTPLAYEYTVDNAKRYLNCDREQGNVAVLHFKHFHPLNDWYGMSPIEAAARSIDQHNVVAEHNLSLLQNGGRPSGALMFRPSPNGTPLTDSQREGLREDIKNIYEGSTNAGKVLVLEGDFDWKEMGLSPKDLDFIEGKNLSAREIAQAFGVPPILVGIPGDATFANYKEARYHLWEDTIVPLIESIVAELNLWLCPFFDKNLRLGYDLDSIPALALRREATWNKISTSNFLTINEKRQAVGYSPIPGGDIL